jgi:hypothetical protein
MKSKGRGNKSHQNQAPEGRFPVAGGRPKAGGPLLADYTAPQQIILLT